MGVVRIVDVPIFAAVVRIGKDVARRFAAGGIVVRGLVAAGIVVRGIVDREVDSAWVMPIGLFVTERKITEAAFE